MNPVSNCLGHSPLIPGPKMAENPKILSIVAAQGLESTIKVKAINLKRRPDNSGDDHIHLLSFVLFFLTHSPPFWPRIGLKIIKYCQNGG